MTTPLIIRGLGSGGVLDLLKVKQIPGFGLYLGLCSMCAATNSREIGPLIFGFRGLCAVIYERSGLISGLFPGYVRVLRGPLCCNLREIRPYFRLISRLFSGYFQGFGA